jgi:hypothetical protein
MVIFTFTKQFSYHLGDTLTLYCETSLQSIAKGLFYPDSLSLTSHVREKTENTGVEALVCPQIWANPPLGGSRALVVSQDTTWTSVLHDLARGEAQPPSAKHVA